MKTNCNLVRGDELTPSQREEVLSAFVHRWTRENPHRTTVYKCHLCDIRKPYENPKSSDGHTHPTIPLISDDQWLADHAFYITKAGHLAKVPGNCVPAYVVDL